MASANTRPEQLLASWLAGDAVPPMSPDMLAERYKDVQSVLDLGVPPELLPPSLSLIYKMASEARYQAAQPKPTPKPTPYPDVRAAAEADRTCTREEMDKALDVLRTWVEEERKPPPAKPLRMERNNMLSDFQQKRKAWEQRMSEKRRSPGVNLTIVGLGRHVSRTPISQLIRISISELLVRKTHHGKYLLCRVIGPCVRSVGVSIPIEDPEGSVHQLLVFNYPTADNVSPQDLDALFPLGLVLAIREPSLETATFELDSWHNPFVWVDSPTDIIHVDERTPALFNDKWKSGPLARDARPVPTSVGAWKQAGNGHFNRGRWFPAAMAYTRGLVLDPKAYLVRLNRSEAYLRLGYFYAALADAQEVLSLPDVPLPSREKALFRASKACYGRGDYEAAAMNLVELLRSNPKHQDASKELKRAQLRLREVRKQDYDWAALLKQTESSPRADAADYVGPIKVAALKGRGGGRGLVATRSIVVGELLIVAKPLISVWPQDLPTNEIAQGLHGLTGDDLVPTQLLLRGWLVSKLYGNPELTEAVHALYAGPRMSASAAKFPLVSNQPALAKLDLGLPTVDILTGRIEEMIPYNTFGVETSLVPDPPSSAQKWEDNVSLAGQTTSVGSLLYLLPSLFNHSCLPNTSKLFFGELMVVRALQPIAAGAEITLDYGMGIMEDGEEKTKMMRLYFDGGDCLCAHCTADRSDGPAALQKRRELCQAAVKASQGIDFPYRRLQQIEKEIEATYTTPRAFYADLQRVREIVASVFQMSAIGGFPRLWLSAAEEGIRALEAAGVKVLDDFVEGPLLPATADKLPISTARVPCGHAGNIITGMLRTACRLHQAGESKRCERWLRASIWVSDAVLGGGKRAFEAAHSEYIQEWNLGPLLVHLHCRPPAWGHSHSF